MGGERGAGGFAPWALGKQASRGLHHAARRASGRGLPGLAGALGEERGEWNGFSAGNSSLKCL